MNILGISAFYHDSAACLVQDGRIVAAAQEERFTRKKHDADFPRKAAEYCVAEAGIGFEQLDLVAFYDKFGWQVRAAYNWRDEFLAFLGGGADGGVTFVSPAYTIPGATSETAIPSVASSCAITLASICWPALLVQ